MAALVALLVASAASLAVPVAVRRVIDHGFSGGNLELVNQYFGTMIGVVLALAVGSAARFYFVMWIGERVVADLLEHGLGGPVATPAVEAAAPVVEAPAGAAEIPSAAPAEENADETTSAEPVAR